MQSEWKSAWIRGGKISEVTWIDKDVMAWSSGTHIVFFNCAKSLQALWRCPESIDGVSLLSSHLQMHLIAFSECCENPRILLFTYPRMEMISECSGGSKNGYLAVAFASTEFVISLASVPDCCLILWNWRTGKQLHSIDTCIHDLSGQMIRISKSKPPLIGQLGRDSGRLFIWLIIANSTSSLNEEVILPKKAVPTHIDWSPDPQEPILAIVDESGHVYLCNKHGGEVHRIIFSQRCATCLDYEIPAVAWFNDGILLKTTFCQMRFYKKMKENNWRKQWYIKTPMKPYILSAHPFMKNQLFFFTHEGIIMRMNLEIEETCPKVEKIFDYGSSFEFLDFIYPWCHHLVAMKDSENIKIINSHNGQEIGNVILDVEGKISYLVSHPDYPLIAISTSVGELCLVTTYNFKSPRVLCKYNFDNEKLDLIKFSQCGRHLITGRKRYGNFHCITAIDESFSTVRKIETDHRVLDIVFFDSNNVLTIVMVILPFKRAVTGNCLLIYKLSPTDSNVKDPAAVLKMPGPYDHFHYGLEPMTIIASQYSSRQIHNFQVKENQICLKNAIQSPHQVRAIRVYTNRNWIVSYGLDGFVGIIKDFNTSQFLVSVNAHHRMDYGVARAMVNLSSELIVALGSDGSLVCMRLQFNDEKTKPSIDFHKILSDERKIEEIIEFDYSELNPVIREMLSQQSCQSIPPEESGARTWTDWMTRQRELKEEEEFRHVKVAILEDFEKIKEQVTKLLDENEQLPEEERLPISAFDLDMIGREQKMKAAKEEREETRLEGEFQCAEMEKVANWIKMKFWDPQKVKQQSIFAIFGDTEVLNFPSVSQDPHEKEMARWLESFTELETKSLITDSEVKKYSLFKEKYSPTEEEEKTIMESILEDEDEAAEAEKLEEVKAASGITTSKFIEATSQFCQFKQYNFSQLLGINNFLMTDAQKLKNYFNKLFNDTFALKERAMHSVTETVSNIHFIDSELRLMFDSSVADIPIAPEWSYKEKPESIITVTDDEVPVSPYISPSHQAILNKQAEEQERLRQLMLADDFRRRALMEMMDGVLEVRWEDIIKKDIPKPEFMETKEPQDYTKDEIIMIQTYERDVENLMRERERYRGILEVTYEKKMKSLQETVDRFNTTLKDLFQTRMRVESAILQLHLLRMRGYSRAFQRMEMFHEENKIRGEISEQESQMERIKSLTKPLHDQLALLKSQRDILLNKDKQEKNFKVEFPSLGKTTLEFLKKQYKRRPKIILKIGTAGDLYVLAKCIVTRDASVQLLSDYKNYHTNLHALDIQPENLPETVQLHHWEHLVKIRRQKIELELKLKANSIEIKEIEQFIAENNGRIEMCKKEVVNLGVELKKATDDHSDFVNDMEIQLVLKMGQVEIPLRGQRNETENSKLIPIEIVQNMNEDILKAGDEKLKAMQSLLEFKRGTLAKEWEHKTLKMKIEDLQEELKEIKNILVTKRMQEYLRNQSLGRTEGKTTQDLEKQIEAMQKIVEKSLNDWILKIEALENQIEAKKEENALLDKKITKMNVDRWEMELKRDLAVEEQSKEFNEKKMQMIMHRSKLCRKIQRTFNDVSALRLESELLRMKKYPALPGCNVISEDGCNC